MSRRSGSMSGEWKRSMVGYSGTGNRKGQTTRKASPKPPRHSSTLPVSVLDVLQGTDGGEDVAGFSFLATGDGSKGCGRP